MNIIALVVGFGLMVLFGFWLSKVGRPYNGVLFNVHKLIALGVMVGAVILFSGTLKALDYSPLWVVDLGVAGVCVAASFASGALMSAGKLGYPQMLLIHRSAAVVLTLTLALAIYPYRAIFIR